LEALLGQVQPGKSEVAQRRGVGRLEVAENGGCPSGIAPSKSRPKVVNPLANLLARLTEILRGPGDVLAEGPGVGREGHDGTRCVCKPTVDIYEDYGVQRSGRRGFTTYAKNLGFTDPDISLICRWQTERNRGGRAKFSSMVAAYTDYRQAKDARIKISKKF